MVRVKRRPDDYGDDPHVADFGPDVTVADIRQSRREVTLMVNQRPVTKTVPTEIRR